MLATLTGGEASATRVRVDSGCGVVEAARTALEEHRHFRGRSQLFVLTAYEGILVVRGVAPSYYIKQMVQSVLGQIEGVARVDNQVAVINPQGLSSVQDDADRPGRRLTRASRRCLMKLA
jgi:hypothetical protein